MTCGFRAKIEFDSEEEAKIVYTAVAVENAKLYLDGNTLTLMLQAEELSSLRAKVNAWLRTIKVCKDLLEALR